MSAVFPLTPPGFALQAGRADHADAGRWAGLGRARVVCHPGGRIGLGPGRRSAVVARHAGRDLEAGRDRGAIFGTHRVVRGLRGRMAEREQRERGTEKPRGHG
jgi:hypothetical protein